jgi:two-component system, chemotaxis family, sensor kinase CheA
VLEQLVHEAVTGEPSQVEMEQILSLLREALPKSLNLEPAAIVEPILPVSISSALIEEDQELREIYRVTSEERLLKLESSLNELANHSEPAAVLETMRRQIHSLKGDSRSVGLEMVSMIAQQLEDIIKHLQNRELTFTPELSDCLSQGLNGVRGLVYEAVTGMASGVNIELLLNQLIAVFTPSALEQGTTIQVNVPSSSQTHDGEEAAPSAWASLIDDEELRELYRVTSEGRLQRLEIGLLHLEYHPDDTAILAELIREAHSLKGDSRSIGVEAIEVLIHQVEEILRLIQCQAVVLTSETSDRLYLTLDIVKQVLHTTVMGEPNHVNVAEVTQMLSQLTANSPEFGSTSTQQQQPLELDSLPTVSEAIADEELREIYRLTTEERLQRLEAGLIHLERHPSDLSCMAELMREVHSLKGDARTTGVEEIEAVSHQFEDVLGHIQRQTVNLTPEIGDRLYQSLDAMRQLIHTAVTGEPSLLDTALVLNQLLEIVPASAITEVEEALPIGSDLPSSLLSTESARIDTIRVPTRNLDTLIAQAEELTIAKIQFAQITKQANQVETLWQERKANRRSNQASVSGSLNADPYDNQLEEVISELRRSVEENNIVTAQAEVGVT